MDQQGIWKRMGEWFRRAGQPVSGELPPVGRDGLLHGVGASEVAEPEGEASTPRLSKTQAREQTLEKLQEGYFRVIDLMETLTAHMAAQDRRGEAMAGSLDGVAGHMARLSEAAERQGVTLGEIATQLQANNERSRRWEDAFAEFPALAEAQRATLATLGDQMSAARNADERIGDSLEAVRGALDTLDRSTSASTTALRHLQASSTHNQELMGELIQKQRNWLSRLVIVTLCVALVAVGLAVVALVR